ncbi:hypothetical protein S349_43 [Shewanella sp. phage 3/49]|uniref:tail protein n=1 Tax=Shewanella sp. phage 3/49 TaxID=1458863 RepID=UPI0004F67630|nr:tail protein [Shewanella sp. phage 3/49]AHK11833.1 hypothetical protein S349_43 [Shewanella sp. phage 3/49]
MAIINHYVRCENGEFKNTVINKYPNPMEFIVNEIADGVPFRCISGGKDISQDFDAMLLDGEFIITESPGGFVAAAIAVVSLVIGVAAVKYLTPSIDLPSANNQAVSANNSLTNRTNKPRPYARAYDICGTVQSIPSDLMQPYSIYDETNKQFDYGYYYVARGNVETPVSGVLDGDTLLSTVTGSSANFFDPYTSPNNSTPSLIIGEQIDEPLFIGVRSNSVDGLELRAPNEYILRFVDVEIICTLDGTVGVLTDSTGGSSFNELFEVGQVVILSGIESGTANLDGFYTVRTATDLSITFDISPGISLIEWQKIAGGSAPMTPNNQGARIIPENMADVGYTDWVTISTIKPKRIVANVVARQGMYRSPSSSSSIASSSAMVQMNWQLVGDDGIPYGPINSAIKTLDDKTREEVGMSIFVDMPTQSAVRVRLRRSSDVDFDFNGTVVDALTYNDLYGQIEDLTPHYGNLTTVHTKRKATAQATSIKQPQLKVLSTEMAYKYLGNGVFDTVLSANTQAVQSLIRMMRDPLVGNLNMSTDSMDKLLEVQDEIESYFNDVSAGQFSYTFDDGKTTAQEICQTIANAAFCTVYREGNDIRLFFDKPATLPAMVFTHRSKVGSEKWTRSFGSDAKDSVEFSYIDPDTNIRETIYIPGEGGINPRKIESKGVRSYQQAYWLAHRARQRDLLNRVAVEFTATEEGIYVVSGEAISVVKGSRVASYDGYIVAKNGLTLTLSQEVEFTAGDQHYIQLKKRDGRVEVIQVVAGANARTVLMLSSPAEEIYTANSALKTEFSFGNEARHLAQMIVPSTIEPQQNKTVKITGRNYHPGVYLFDGDGASVSAFSNGFSNGFLI